MNPLTLSRLACAQTWLARKLCSHRWAVRHYEPGKVALWCPDCGWQSAGLTVEVKALTYQQPSWHCATEPRPVHLKA
jgi:hypothetical protein